LREEAERGLAPRYPGERGLTMSNESTGSRRERLTLAADGLLLTAGAFGVFAGASFVLVSVAGGVPLGEDPARALTAPLQFISWLLTVIGFALGPIVTWLLYRRRFTWRAVLGGVFGSWAGGLVVWAIAMLVAGVTFLVKAVTGSEYGGAIGMLVLIVLAVIMLIAWLVVDAVRDLSASRRAHVGLDVGRLVTTLGVLAFGAGTGYVMQTSGNADPEAGVFMLMAGILGATAVFAADFAERVFGKPAIAAPVDAPAAGPVDAPAAAPVEAPAAAPVEAPVDSPPNDPSTSDE